MKHFGASRAELKCPVVDHESDEMGANGFTVECLSFRSREASCKPRVGYRALSGNLSKHLCARNRAWIFHFVQSAQRFRFISLSRNVIRHTFPVARKALSGKASQGIERRRIKRAFDRSRSQWNTDESFFIVPTKEGVLSKGRRPVRPVAR